MARRVLQFLSRIVPIVAIVGLLALGGIQPARAVTPTTWYVDASASGGSGTTWVDAFSNPQDALAVAAAGDQIWVANGTYRPGISRSDTFDLLNGVAMYGGFAGGEALLSERNPAVNVAILSGDIGTIGDVTDNSYHVVTSSGLSSGTILDGFTITGGNANGTSLASGGGGFLGDSSTAGIFNVVFKANRAKRGGAVYANSSNLGIERTTFTNNKAGAGGGGALYAYNSGPDLVNVTFEGNTTTGNGGAIYSSGSVPALLHATISGNTASGSGDGIYATGGGGPFVSYGILWGNGTQEIVDAGGAATSISNSIVEGVSGGDPKLGPLQKNGGFTPTMALGPGSAAIDKGASVCTLFDQRGIGRPKGPRCDLGAFEVKVFTFASVAAYDSWVLESAENSSLGGSKNTGASTLRVGDDAANRQYRSVVSFNTGNLPDGATVVLAKVRIEEQGLVGTNPFSTHTGLTLDLAKPYFGAGVSLAISDFQAASTVSPAGAFKSTPSGAWYTGFLNASGRAAVNKKGTTQLRLRFILDDNNDGGADYLLFFSGDSVTASDRPKFMVYFVP